MNRLAIFFNLAILLVSVGAEFLGVGPFAGYREGTPMRAFQGDESGLISLVLYSFIFIIVPATNLGALLLNYYRNTLRLG